MYIYVNEYVLFISLLNYLTHSVSLLVDGVKKESMTIYVEIIIFKSSKYTHILFLIQSTITKNTFFGWYTKVVILILYNEVRYIIAF